jgi:protease I
MGLVGRRVAVLAEDVYQELEFWYPVMRFREKGADVVVAAPRTDQPCRSFLGYPLVAESAISELDPFVLDAVVVPGGPVITGRAAGDLPAFFRSIHQALPGK